jgi:hypothetical protein
MFFQVLSSISSKSPAEQDEYLSAADVTFTTASPLADMLELSRSGSNLFTPEQNRCLVHTIARLKQSAGSNGAEDCLLAPVAAMDLTAAASLRVTHANLKEYEECVAETLCWGHSHVLLTAMRDGHVASSDDHFRCSLAALTRAQVRGVFAAQGAAPQACPRRAHSALRTAPHSCYMQ